MIETIQADRKEVVVALLKKLGEICFWSKEDTAIVRQYLLFVLPVSFGLFILIGLIAISIQAPQVPVKKSAAVMAADVVKEKGGCDVEK